MEDLTKQVKKILQEQNDRPFQEKLDAMVQIHEPLKGRQLTAEEFETLIVVLTSNKVYTF